MRSGLALVFLLISGVLSTAQTALSGSGSTFVTPIMTKWVTEYEKAHPEVQISYMPNGSTAGMAQVTRGLVDFGATDAPLTNEQLSNAKTKVIHVPVIIGAVVPAYNLKSVQAALKFTPQILAGIFLGKIAKWNDAALATANPGVPLPDELITIAHRSEGSGTTYVWTEYLSKVSPEWKQRIGQGTSVKWPTGIEGKGNEGVAAAIRQKEGSIGYLELAYAVRDKIAYGSVQNASGEFVQATVNSTSAAASSAQIPDDLRVSISNSPAAGSYPIASFSWILVPASLHGTTNSKALADFLTWVVGDGQRFAADLFYAPLPNDVVRQARKAINQTR
jgi:phosphate transport system substrate-binding protein